MKPLADNPTRVYLGAGIRKELPKVLSEVTDREVLLVTGSRSFQESPYFDDFMQLLSDFKITTLSGVHKEPRFDELEGYLNGLADRDLGCVLAVGGGSVLDVAKMIALLYAQSEKTRRAFYSDPAGFRDFEKNRVPLIAMPTTSGTGSEVTPYASFEDDLKRKISVDHALLYPVAALVDADLTVSMPASVTASTGCDALSQAIEAYWAVKHNPVADQHALAAIPEIMRNLRLAVEKPDDVAVREAMAEASMLAGKAIAHTRTTAVHSVSYPLTTLYGIPHGHACALTLPAFMCFNADAIGEGRDEMLWQSCGAGSAGEAAEKVGTLISAIGLERKLGALGLETADVDKVVQNGFRPDRVKNNPRQLSAGQLSEILKSLL